MNDFEWTYEVPTAMVQLTKENSKVGLRVRIAETSKFYDRRTRINPSDVDGIVTGVIDGWMVRVQWPTCTWPNSYRHEDLVIVDHDIMS